MIFMKEPDKRTDRLQRSNKNETDNSLFNSCRAQHSTNIPALC